MNNKLVIVIPNEQQVRIPLFVKKCNYHAEGIKSFIFNNDINLDINENSISFPEMAFELSKQDYLVMGYDEVRNIKTLIIFLPNEISPNQLEYFVKRKEGLKDYNLMFYSYGEDYKIQMHDKMTVQEEPIIDNLMNELNNRLIDKKKKTK